ncbi:MAG: hypothetical protein J3K34DRAFT_520563 [Monoraphidium minutum]|nr:MAG: hypothetical protein J3K34DRAFT_520563 [Monoraphidium minutum]
MAALALQQVVVEAPPLQLARGGAAADAFRSLAARAGVPHAAAGGGDPAAAFDAVLDRLLAAGLASWIVDWVATVCCEGGIGSDDPSSAHLLGPAAVAGWCGRAADAARRRLGALLAGEGGGEGGAAGALAAVGAAAGALLHVAAALPARDEAADLTSRLELLCDAARAAAYCCDAGVPLRGTPPAYASRPVWQGALAGRRGRAPGGRLFVDDLLDALGPRAPGAHAPPPAGRATRAAAAAAAAAAAPPPLSYPWASPAAAVEALFGGAGGGGGAAVGRRAALGLLHYYLADGGWAAPGGRAAAAYARAFRLPPGLVAEWGAQQLLDRVGSGGGSGGGGGEAELSRACELLLGAASVSTPFSVVEALAAAGRPDAALAVQRARGGAGGGGGGLREAGVLLDARLACGLLEEAHAAMRAHVEQLPPRERQAQLAALMGRLLEWAAGRGDGGLQRVAALPLSGGEEAALAGWLEARAAAGVADGGLLPLYYLQRGRTLEALAAYSRWRDAPGAAAAAPGTPAAARAARLGPLLAAAAAALPPCLRGAALPGGGGGGGGGGGATGLLSGLPGMGAEAAGPALLLAPRGPEPPVFLSPLVPPGGPAAAGEAEPAPSAGGEAGAGGGGDDGGGAPLMAAAGGAPDGEAALAAAPAALPGGLLFGVPAAPGGSLFGAAAAAAPAAGGAVPDGGAMSEAEFRAHLLGPAAGARQTPRTTKRQRF